ncbi:MAG TPA: winged helix-turn-helix domain-containing protein [Gammaproteobacteria bacterium]|nr:winged helix-turn-helix domain-containing protein [Gammaproteobacteria bacterium]
MQVDPGGLEPTYEFGGFRLDLGRRLLFSCAGNRPLPLTPRVLDTLVYLVRHPGVLLDHSTLMDFVWPDAAVEPNNLNQNVAKLRKLLGEKPGEKRFIETVPGRGYRFTAKVRVVRPAAEPSAETGPASRLDEETRHLYLQALRLMHRPTPDNCELARRYFETVLARDAEFAEAWAALADTYLFAANVGHLPLAALVDAERHARRALELKPSLSVAHTIIGTVRAQRWDWLTADSHFVTAISLDGRDAMPRCLHAGFILYQLGHVRRGLEQTREAYRLLPDDPRMLMNLAISHCLAGSDAEALHFAQLAVGFGFPEDIYPVPLVFVHAALHAGDYSAAASHAAHLLPAGLDAAGVVQVVYAALADARLREHAVAAVLALVDRSFRLLLGTSGAVMVLVEWLACLGRPDLALDLIDRSIDLCAEDTVRPATWQALWLRELAPLREDFRFAGLADRIGFSTYWKVFGPADVD